MTKEVMNVHRALAELKIIDSRIKGKILVLTTAVANKANNKKINGESIETFIQQQKEAYQSVVDLIKRRNAIKRAVVLSNAKTMVNIGGVEYTVAEAIEMKNSGIRLQRELLDRLDRVYTAAVNKCNSENTRANDLADEFAKSAVGGEKNTVKTEEYESQRKAYLANNTWSIVDAIYTPGEIKSLEQHINDFMLDVDAVLSSSNANTEIEIEY